MTKTKTATISHIEGEVIALALRILFVTESKVIPPTFSDIQAFQDLTPPVRDIAARVLLGGRQSDTTEYHRGYSEGYSEGRKVFVDKFMGILKEEWDAGYKEGYKEGYSEAAGEVP